MPVISRQCEGYTLSGQQCRKRAANGQRYCSIHSRAAEIGIPPYVKLTADATFAVYLPISRPRWKVGDVGGLLFKCPASGSTYQIDSYAAEGTYGAVYYGRCTQGANEGRQIAAKVFKEVYRHRKKDVAADDFAKEYFMYSAVRDRVGAGCTVDMLDTFFLKTGDGLHGCLVMERMEGDLGELFRWFSDRPARVEVLRFWVFCCNFIAGALLRLHSKDIFHLDIKPDNVLWRRSTSGAGVRLRLVDLGLGCYMDDGSGRYPRVPCVATGTYIPLEWRKDGDPSVPTFQEVGDRHELRRGEAYALCVTCHKLLKRVSAELYSRNARIAEFRELLERGMRDEVDVRSTAGVRAVYQLSSEILDEIPFDVTALRQILPRPLSPFVLSAPE